jgi:hypothetical protein
MQIMNELVEFNPKNSNQLLDLYRARKYLAVARADCVHLLQQSDELRRSYNVTASPTDLQWSNLQSAFGWSPDIWQHVIDTTLAISLRRTPTKIAVAVDKYDKPHTVLTFQTERFINPNSSKKYELVFPSELINLVAWLKVHRDGGNTTVQFVAEASSEVTTRTIPECINAVGESKALTVVLLHGSYTDMTSLVRHICFKCVGKHMTCCT